MINQTDIEPKRIRKMRLPMVAFLFVAVIIGVATFIYFRPAVPEEKPPEIRFVRFESYLEQAGSFLGVFSVRNPHRRPITVYHVGAESPYQGEWPETISGGLIFSEELAPGETKLISVHSPPKSDIWRVPIWWEFGTTTTQKLKLMVSQNWQTFRNGQPLPGRQIVQIPIAYPVGSSPYSIAYSPVITNSIMFSTPGDSNSGDVLGEVGLLRR